MTEIRVNITTKAAGKTRKEVRNGREVIIVPAATLPDNVVMNGLMYPADEIEKSFAQLERTPAPLGHPKVNGKFVSARDPEGLNQCWIGAWNENVRREGGRVLMDKVIDVEVAKATPKGLAVLNAIEKEAPIHTSTGLLCNTEAVSGQSYQFIARNYRFDHDAILINEDGAATPDKGVGMFVNSAGDEIDVVNSVYESTDQYLDYAVESIARAMEKRQNAPLFNQIKSAILGAFSQQAVNKENDEMTVSKEQFDALSVQVKGLSESLNTIGETIATAVNTALAPVLQANEAIVNAQKAKDDAELTDLQGRIVAANILAEPEAKELTLNAARGLAKTITSGPAAPVFAPMVVNDKNAGGFKLPAGEAK